MGDAVAGEIDGPGPEGVVAPVAEPGKRERLDATGRGDRIDRIRVDVGLLHQPLLAVLVHGDEAGTRHRQRPTVPAGDHLVGVVFGAGHRSGPVAHPRQRCALEEAHIGCVGDDFAGTLDRHVEAAAMQRMPEARHVVPHLEAVAAGDLLGGERGRDAGDEIGVTGRGSGQLALELIAPIDASDRQPCRPQSGRRRGDPIPVAFGHQHPGHGADVLLELEAGGVGVDVEHPEPLLVAEPQQPAMVIAAR